MLFFFLPPPRVDEFASSSNKEKNIRALVADKLIGEKEVLQW